MKKRGIIRIIEMVFAVIIISIVVLTLAANRKTQSERDLSEILPTLLEEVARNAKLREQILAEGPDAEDEVVEFLSERIKNPSLSYDVKICNLEDVCSLDEYPDAREVFAGERVISKTLKSPEETGPKKLKLFVWIKTE